jgi:hypothetical protein
MLANSLQVDLQYATHKVRVAWLICRLGAESSSEVNSLMKSRPETKYQATLTQ